MSIKSIEDLLREASITEVIEKSKRSSEFKLLEWISTAKPGNIHIYYVGSRLDIDLIVWKLKNIVFNWAVEGRVILLQRKIKEDVYEYLVQKPYKRLSKRLITDDYKTTR